MASLRILLLVALSATAAMAQEAVEEKSHWGVSGSFTPRWEFLHLLEDSMDKVIDMTGDELRVGFVRGKQLGGEWGVSYIKRRVDDDSSIVQEKPKCLSIPGQADVCAAGNSYTTRGALLNGVQIHRFFPVGTIAKRVQIGAVISGGVGRLEGEAAETQEHLQISAIGGTPRVTVGLETRTVDARSAFSHTFVSEFVPIGGIEGAVAVLVAPGVKLRVSGGASFPGVHRVSVTAQYLFGSR